MARAGRTELSLVEKEVTACTACPRLVAHREDVAQTKRRAYAKETYWGRPIAGFGDPRARFVIVGLAPGAHGANRTGRIFTGDRSGDFLYAALHRAGFASQPASVHAKDGLVLRGVWITLAARCVPPDNHPSREEVRRCGMWLDRELALLAPRVVLALGAIAWGAVLDHLGRNGGVIPTPRPSFTHGARIDLLITEREKSLRSKSLGREATVAALRELTLFGSYHVSQQNTQTGRLTPRMFDEILGRSSALCAVMPANHG